MAKVQIACPCPGTPHAEGDEIVLRDRLDSTAGLAIKYAVTQRLLELKASGELTPEGNVRDEAVAYLLMAFVNQRYLIYGISSWTLVDAEGTPQATSSDRIRAFMEDAPAEAMAVGDQADAMYAQAVMLPLQRLAASSSQPGRTNGSTSANGALSIEKAMSAPSPKTRKRSSPSSTASTSTDDIATTSPSSAGDSKPSPNSASAGG